MQDLSPLIKRFDSDQLDVLQAWRVQRAQTASSCILFGTEEQKNFWAANTFDLQYGYHLESIVTPFSLEMTVDGNGRTFSLPKMPWRSTEHYYQAHKVAFAGLKLVLAMRLF